MTIRKDKFDEREEDFYEALYKQSQAQFGNYVAAGTLVNNYAHIFDLLVRLRQSVNHPYLVVHSATSSGPKVGTNIETQSGVCGICHDPVEDSVESSCHHTFCRMCIEEYMTDDAGLQVRLVFDARSTMLALSKPWLNSSHCSGNLPCMPTAFEHCVVWRWQCENKAYFIWETETEHSEEDRHHQISEQHKN